MPKRAMSEVPEQTDYATVHADIVALLELARRAVARSVNGLITASYWQIGRRIVECEQDGQAHAARGEQLLQRLSVDLGGRFGRGFSVDNLEQMRLFYLAYPPGRISETLSRQTLEPGFLCKITPVGRKVFMLQYRTNAGERRKPALGLYGELTVEQAHSLAQEWLAEVRRGGAQC